MEELHDKLPVTSRSDCIADDSDTISSCERHQLIIEDGTGDNEHYRSGESDGNTQRSTVSFKVFLSEDVEAIERLNEYEKLRRSRIVDEVRQEKKPKKIIKSCIPFSADVSETARIQDIDLYQLNSEMDEDVETQMNRLLNQESKRITTKEALFTYATKQAEHRYKDLPEHIKRELTSDEIDDLRLVFKTFDRKNKGAIDKTDLQIALKSLGFKLSKKSRADMLAVLDKKRKGRVDFVGFLEFIVKFQEGGPDPYEELIRAFDILDVDGKGYMTFDDMRNVADSYGAKLSDRMITEMIDEADQNGDRKITKSEFAKVMLRTNKFQIWAFADP